jgi:hypothetical protein
MMSLPLTLAFEVMLLLLAANGSPVLATRILGERGAWSVDCGWRWRDGRPLFGPGKTWRGVIVGVLVTGLVAQLLGYGFGFGLLFGAASLFGDLVSSFVKRRLGMASGDRFIGLDQIPEALLPLLVGRSTLGLDGLSIGVLVVLFVIGALVLSRFMFRVGIRRQPH